MFVKIIILLKLGNFFKICYKNLKCYGYIYFIIIMCYLFIKCVVIFSKN